MYDKINIVLQRVDEAREIITNSRKKYDKLMKVIEQFIVDNSIIVRSNDKYFFDVFVPDIAILPKELTLLLYNTDPVLAKYATMVIKIYNKLSKILINNITFVQFTYINKEINNNILDYECPSFFITDQHKCLGPELQLIDIYCNLYNPNLINKWGELYNQEKILNEQLKSRYKVLIDSISKVGGSADDEIITENLSVIEILLVNFIKKNHVIIGQFATNIYNKRKTDNIKRLQIISDTLFNFELRKIKKIFENSNYIVTHLHIPTNLNIYKMTIYLNNVPILDIFNSGQFHTIPYHTINSLDNKSILNGALQIASPFVIKCYKLIDIWNILYMNKINYIKKDIASNIIETIVHDYFSLDKITDIKILFPFNYIGYYEDANLKRERLANRLKIKFLIPYTPYMADVVDN